MLNFSIVKHFHSSSIFPLKFMHNFIIWTIYSFEEKHLKYRLVSLESRKPVIMKHIDIDLKTSLPSKLHPYIQDFIKELVSEWLNAWMHE